MGSEPLVGQAVPAGKRPGRLRSVPSLLRLRPGPLSKVCRVRSGYPLSPEVIAQSAGRGSISPCWWESKHKHKIPIAYQGVHVQLGTERTTASTGGIEAS